MDPGDERRLRLSEYARLLADYDRANVIGVREFERVLLDHVLDSLSCLLSEPLGRARSLIDVGSGGGLPGIPLGLALPNLKVVLAESTGKKASFLSAAAQTLRLTNALVKNERIEALAHQAEHRGMYDVATARAVARLSVVAEYCVPCVRVGGSVVSMKGRLQEEELAEGRRAAAALGAEISDVMRVPLLPEVGRNEHRLVIMQKVRPTPARYPRAPGRAAKRPLGAD